MAPSTARAATTLATVTALAVTTVATVAGLSRASGDATAEGVASRTRLPQGVPVLALPRPADFVPRVTHRYFPLRPGTRWVYRTVGGSATQRDTVTVLQRTNKILGIEATVVHDVAREDGEVIEDTYDWYAQDRLGNVWYLGEATTSYDGGQISHAGSWEAGVNGAYAGIVMPADPELGAPYRQEYLRGEAEDRGVVLDTHGTVTVRGRLYRRVLMTRDTTRLEPELVELKFYAPGVGNVMELGVSPAPERVVLVKYHRG